MKCVNGHKITKSNKLWQNNECMLCRQIRRQNLARAKIMSAGGFTPRKPGRKGDFQPDNSLAEKYHAMLDSLSFTENRSCHELDFGDKIYQRMKNKRLERLTTLGYIERKGQGRWSKYRKLKGYDGDRA